VMNRNRNLSTVVIVAVVTLAALMLSACAAFSPAEEEAPEEQAAATNEFGNFTDTVEEAGQEAPAEEEEMAEEDFRPDNRSSGDDGSFGDFAEGADEAPAAEPAGPIAGGAGADADFNAAPEESGALDFEEAPAAERDAFDDTESGEFAPPAEPFNAPDVEFVPSLTAGEINDNELWRDYLEYRRQFENSGWDQYVWNVDVEERHVINIETAGGLPVLGADVQVYSGQDLVTDFTSPATGTVYFFPNVYRTRRDQQYEVVVSKNQTQTSFDLTPGQSNEWFITLDVPPTQPPVQVDVLFLLDATGSMGDEIDQLKDNILSISAQIEALPANPDVRFGMVLYRDRGDEYVTRNYGFTGDVQEFQEALVQVRAAGGGDKPESLNEALHVAVNEVTWRSDETAKLIFLVSDAPPHLDYPRDFDYTATMQDAAEQGIKVHTIASSGLEDTGPYGEFIYRQIAQYTGGNFIFLTYDSQPRVDQEPGRDVAVPEDNYSVEDLDALVIRLIAQELAALNGQQ